MLGHHRGVLLVLDDNSVRSLAGRGHGRHLGFFSSDHRSKSLAGIGLGPAHPAMASVGQQGFKLGIAQSLGFVGNNVVVVVVVVVVVRDERAVPVVVWLWLVVVIVEHRGLCSRDAVVGIEVVLP